MPRMTVENDGQHVAPKVRYSVSGTILDGIAASPSRTVTAGPESFDVLDLYIEKFGEIRTYRVDRLELLGN